jgi:hypothetical protein
MRKPKEVRNRTVVAVITLLLLLGLVQTSTAARPSGGKKTQAKGTVVYVCSCLKTQSCSCMSEAKTEGPCACGTSGGPPMKAVPSNSAWAKANRRSLAK